MISAMMGKDRMTIHQQKGNDIMKVFAQIVTAIMNMVVNRKDSYIRNRQAKSFANARRGSFSTPTYDAKVNEMRQRRAKLNQDNQ